MRNEKIWKLMGSFLALMLACTVLSRASASLTVAVVQTASPGRMVLSHRITAVGKVLENQEHAVSVEAGQRISHIAVREGDLVEPGDVLLLLDMEELRGQILSCKGEIRELEWEAADLESARDIQQEKRELALQRAQEDYAWAVERGNQAVRRAEDERNAAIDRLHAYYAGVAAQMNGSVDEEQEGLLAEAVDGAQKACEDAVAARQEGILQAQRAWEDAQIQEPPDSVLQQKRTELKEKRKQLRKLKKMKKSGGKVTSPVKGAVTQINTAAGEWTTQAVPLLLADLSTGCRFVTQVDKGEEEYLEKHMPVTLTNEVKKQTVENLEIDSIEVSREDPSLLDICVYLPADALEIGDSAQMTAEKKSQAYNTCIPIQALHQSNGMKFVYVVGEKDTVLGKQLTAMEVSVTVQEQNEMYAALADGCLASGQKVIKDSNKAIGKGSTVRLDAS